MDGHDQIWLSNLLQDLRRNSFCWKYQNILGLKITVGYIIIEGLIL